MITCFDIWVHIPGHQNCPVFICAFCCGCADTGSKPHAPGSPDVERLWNEYFSDPRQWWDNRAKKV